MSIDQRRGVRRGYASCDDDFMVARIHTRYLATVERISA